MLEACSKNALSDVAYLKQSTNCVSLNDNLLAHKIFVLIFSSSDEPYRIFHVSYWEVRKPQFRTTIARCLLLIVNMHTTAGRTASETRKSRVLYLCSKAEAI
jgi:hypothetical protein